MTDTAVRPARPAPAPAPRTPRRSRRAREAAPRVRGLVSPHTLTTRRGKIVYWTVLTLVVTLFTAVFVFPLYWMVTGAMKSPDELVRMPPSLFPENIDLTPYAEAWEQLELGTFLLNTLMYAGGAWIITLVVDVSAAYALSKLRPALGRAVLAMMLSTLMIPPMVIILPAYLTVKDLPILGWDLLNTPWAIWLPAAANGFFVFLLKRFFDSIPRELLEAAAIDGASPARILWSIVLPVSRPIIGVVSILSVVAAWKDFVWPLLVLPDQDKMPLSVGIAQLSAQMPQNVLIAALVIASIPAILVFFVFQRNIMAGLTAGGLKG
ncbi:carbohydrate ABC transporter permease [Bailinhaonella thermotolerans]|uniref:Carbohydrate ABC transporter permease n=1 Tax=Bailinhaonella thermotolerans TaxID=1070861 RepID=A0A3A4B3U9_9ACTN|nr:carbohydrate ABC transporter permease [Bailinhaonella thermotolerans]RJL32699.1 carbohydrate ABC transporter permease [Bailinhaonella thermotolerans]